MIITNNEQLSAVRVGKLNILGYVVLEHQRTRYNPISYSVQPLMADNRTIAPCGTALHSTSLNDFVIEWDDETDYKIG